MILRSAFGASVRSHSPAAASSFEARSGRFARICLRACEILSSIMRWRAGRLMGSTERSFLANPAAFLNALRALANSIACIRTALSVGNRSAGPGESGPHDFCNRFSAQKSTILSTIGLFPQFSICTTNTKPGSPARASFRSPRAYSAPTKSTSFFPAQPDAGRALCSRRPTAGRSRNWRRPRSRRLRGGRARRS